MTVAWESELPTGPKMVLLALCDNANDQGTCYPSVEMLERKCSMSRRSVFSHLQDLEHIGAVTRIQRPGRSTYYQLDPCKFCTPADFAPLQPLHPSRADSAPPPVQPLHPRGANSAPITVNEPTHSVSKKKAQPIDMPEGVDADVWAAYLDVRKAKKASPMSAIALQGIEREAAKAKLTLNDALRTCVERNWQSLRADWLQQPARNNTARPAGRYAGAGAAIFEDATHV